MPRTPMPDDAFRLPKYIADDVTCGDLVVLFNVIVQRLREEAAHLTLNTIQEMLLERIATNYIILRWRERGILGEGGFEHSTAAKDANSFWLSMTREFNAQVKVGDAEFRDAYVKQVNEAIAGALEGMHEDVANPLRERFAAAFEKVGL